MNFSLKGKSRQPGMKDKKMHQSKSYRFQKALASIWYIFFDSLQQYNQIFGQFIILTQQEIYIL